MRKRKNPELNIVPARNDLSSPACSNTTFSCQPSVPGSPSRWSVTVSGVSFTTPNLGGGVQPASKVNAPAASVFTASCRPATAPEGSSATAFSISMRPNLRPAGEPAEFPCRFLQDSIAQLLRRFGQAPPSLGRPKLAKNNTRTHMIDRNRAGKDPSPSPPFSPTHRRLSALLTEGGLVCLSSWPRYRPSGHRPRLPPRKSSTSPGRRSRRCPPGARSCRPAGGGCAGRSCA